MKREKKKSKKWINILLIIIILIAIIGLAIAVAYMYNKEGNSTFLGTDKVDENKEPIVISKDEVKIYKGNDRPIAVMIDNNKDAWPIGRNK